MEYVSWFIAGSSTFNPMPKKALMFDADIFKVKIPALLTENERNALINREGVYYDKISNALCICTDKARNWIVSRPLKAIGKMMASDISRHLKRKMTYVSNHGFRELEFSTPDSIFGKLYFRVDMAFEVIGIKLPSGKCAGLVGVWGGWRCPDGLGLSEFKVKRYSGSIPEISAISNITEGCNSWNEIKDKFIETYIRAKQSQVNRLAEYYGVDTKGTHKATVQDLL